MAVGEPVFHRFGQLYRPQCCISLFLIILQQLFCYLMSKRWGTQHDEVGFFCSYLITLTVLHGTSQFVLKLKTSHPCTVRSSLILPQISTSKPFLNVLKSMRPSFFPDKKKEEESTPKSVLHFTLGQNFCFLSWNLTELMVHMYKKLIKFITILRTTLPNKKTFYLAAACLEKCFSVWTGGLMLLMLQTKALPWTPL